MGTLAFVLVGTLVMGASPTLALFAVCAAAAGVALAVHRSRRVAVERRRSNDLRR